MAMSGGKDDGSPMMEMNMTPLIDVLLCLLIIFIMSIPVATHSVDIDLPTPSPVPPNFVEPVKNGYGNGESEPEPARIVSKVFDSKFFGYRKVTLDRPPQEGKPVTVKLKKGQKLYDPELRDTENIPLAEDIKAYMKREVLPHVPDAYVNEEVRDEKDGQVGKVGYEINFNRYFYVYKPPRKPQVIAKEIGEMEKRFMELMKGVLA